MVVTVILSALALISLGLLLWQFGAALRFPLHARVAEKSFAPAITLLKPLKNFDEHTAACLRSWLTQKYDGPVQMLFGVADQDDPACFIVRELLKEFPSHDAELIVAAESLGANAKVSTLVQLFRRAKHELICVSDADVGVPQDFLANAVAPLRDTGAGLVNCFYSLAHPTTLAMHLEAIAVNADFWSQVLQSNTLKRQDFALGAVMITRRELLKKIGAFESLLDFLADDYQLGNQIARTGARIELSPLVVECRDKPMNFCDVWKHQLRWARTIRVSQPVPYFFSVLSHTMLWVTLLALFGNLGGFPLVSDSLLYSGALTPGLQRVLAPLHVPWVLVIFLAVLTARVFIVAELQQRLTRTPRASRWWLVFTKDVLGVAVWAMAFMGNNIEWRGGKFRLNRGGRLVPL
ncbi:MAG TPA: glycosyltransferase [Verrucomicrobiae bacterium]